MSKRHIVAWTVALPLALWGSCLLPPLHIEGILILALPVVTFIVGLEVFIILGTTKGK